MEKTYILYRENVNMGKTYIWGKRPFGENVHMEKTYIWGKRLYGGNVHMGKTSIWGKRPYGEIVHTAEGKRPYGENVHLGETSIWGKRPYGENVHMGETSIWCQHTLEATSGENVNLSITYLTMNRIANESVLPVVSVPATNNSVRLWTRCTYPSDSWKLEPGTPFV
jgi:hypothetical protein